MENKTENQDVVVLKPFDIQKAKLAELVKDYESLVVTEETYEEAKKARKVIRDERFVIQNILKENKGILNKIKTDQEAKADELIAIIQPTEDRIDEAIKKIEQAKEEEKKRKEAELALKISQRTATLFDNDMTFNGESYVLGACVITPVQIKIFSDEEFQEFIDSVSQESKKIKEEKEKEAKALAEKQAKLTLYHERKDLLIPCWSYLKEGMDTLDFSAISEEEFDSVLKNAREAKASAELKLKEEQEEQAKKLKEQQEQLAAELKAQEEEQKAFEEEKRKFKEEQDKFEAERKKAEEEKLAKQKAEQEKALAKERAKKEAEEKVLAEQRAKELKPDKEKMLDFADFLSKSYQQSPIIANKEVLQILNDATTMIDGTVEFIRTSINKL
jgi:hypothetical protein